jgi:ribosomal-protein-alanine N-acetyltransferase
MPGVWLTLAKVDATVAGFALSRAIMDEAELLLIAVDPAHRGGGIGGALLRSTIAACEDRGVKRLHLEVRANNPAVALYARHGFARAGVRRNYYRSRTGEAFDAHTYARAI